MHHGVIHSMLKECSDEYINNALSVEEDGFGYENINVVK